MAYTTVAAVRQLHGMADTTEFPDAQVTEAITFAENLVDRYTGTSFEYKAFDVTMTGNGATHIRLKALDGTTVMYPQTVASCTVDGTAVADVSGWALHPHGVIERDTGTFTHNHPGMNVNVTGTAGYSAAAPQPIVWCTETIARQYLIDLVSRIPDRALSIQNDFGTVRLSTPAANRATGLPAVDAELNRYKHRTGLVY